MKKKKKKQNKNQRRNRSSFARTFLRVLLSFVLFVLLGACAYGIYFFGLRFMEKDRLAQESFQRSIQAEQEAKEQQARAEAEAAAQAEAEAALLAAKEEKKEATYSFTPSPNMVTSLAKENVDSEYALLVNLSTREILVNQGGDKKIYPASMTKILTCLVAAEEIGDVRAPFTVTQEMEEYCLINECSAAGFKGGETVPILDLFYGTILPSGGEAAVALATAASGSEEAFVKKMTKKLKTLGLSETTKVKNCVGIYKKKHYSTLIDMAVILTAAMHNELAREVLSAHSYVTTPTEQNPEGLALNNWFLCRIEDFDTGGRVIAAKTGYVEQSGCCAASYMVSNSGIPYICVTGNTYNEWRCIYDHIFLYSTYAQ